MGLAVLFQAVLIVAASLFAPLVNAQQGKVWRIGVLETTSQTMNSANLDALRKGLRELGYVEGKNLVIDYRSVDGRTERYKELANALVLEKVDLIVTRGTPATRAAMAASATIPIVTTSVGSPVRSGLVKSLARPGGNVTGLSAITADLAGKRLGLLKEVFPKITRIGFLANMSNPNSPIFWEETERLARSLGIRARVLDVRKAEDLESAFEAARSEQLSALMIATDTVTQANRKTIAELAVKYRLPTMSSSNEFVGAGALMCYAPNISKLYYRAATYIDRIFKGAKPGDLPIEEPTALELTINLKTAKALGVAIPASVQFRADRLIE
jgi:putative tryptophan/tyrosine transport system substrate-binding protein